MLHLQDNVAFTFKWIEILGTKRIFPKDLNWVKHSVSRVSLSEQFQIKIRHAKFQGKVLEPRKFRQMFLDGCHAWLLWKVKSDPTSMPFTNRIIAGSIKAQWNLNNTGGKSCRYHDVSTSPSTLTKGPKALNFRLDPSSPQVSQNTDENGSKGRVYELLQPLLSTGSKFKSVFITDFPRADKNWQC